MTSKSGVIGPIKSIKNTKTNEAQSGLSLDNQQTLLAREHLTQRNYYPMGTAQKDTLKSLSVIRKPESLAIEAAIAIVINDIHYAVLMASPTELKYLAIGFLFSEGLIEHRHELVDWEITQLTLSNCEQFSSDDSIESSSYNNSVNPADLIEQLQYYDAYVVQLTLSQRRHQRIQEQRRQLAGRTGCGMCGITGLKQALPDLSAYQHDFTPSPNLDELLRLRYQIEKAQQTHQLTGAVHAAATFHNNQLHLFEDVGRHNALDKLIGWQLCQKSEIDYVIMTSRLSIEMVQKAIRCQLPWLIGMSAPTSTAVQVAEKYGLGLAGFLRDNRVTFYTGYTGYSDYTSETDGLYSPP